MYSSRFICKTAAAERAMVRPTNEREESRACHAISSEEEEDEVKLTNKDAEERTKDLKGNSKKEL